MMVGAWPRVRPGINDYSNDRVETSPTPTTIGDVICAFKSLTTHRYSNGVKMGLVKPFRKRLWQRDYHDHIIRNESEYNAICTYITNNPQSSKDSGESLLEWDNVQDPQR